MKRALLTHSIRYSSKSWTSPLEDLHIAAGGKLIDFHGFVLPVSYSNQPLVESAQHCRKKASLFDVSHMLQTKISGENACQLIHDLTVADAKNLEPNSGTLTLFPMENGGILDDLIINKLDDDNSWYVVSNAARKQVDLPHMLKHAKKLKNCEIEILDNPLVALQGPLSERILQDLVDIDLSKLTFMQGVTTEINNSPIRVTRCGYTGEDGFEISFEDGNGVEKLLKSSNDLKWAGLGERDILRLEGGMCLYGNDIDESTTPYSARLLWTVAKSRRKASDFLGSDVLNEEVKNKTPRSGRFRVGIAKSVKKGRAIREGMDLYTADLTELIGKVCSGAAAANCDFHSIGQAYVQKGNHQVGKELKAVPSGKKPTMKTAIDVTITKMPFVKTNYKN